MKKIIKFEDITTFTNGKFPNNISAITGSYKDIKKIYNDEFFSDDNNYYSYIVIEFKDKSILVKKSTGDSTNDYMTKVINLILGNNISELNTYKKLKGLIL